MSARRSNLKRSTSFQSSSDQSEQYEVQKIINKKVQNNKKFYKVVWVGYDLSESTWEPEENLIGCKHKIEQFQIYYKEVLKRKQQGTQQFNHLPDPLEVKRLIMNPALNIHQDKPVNTQITFRDKETFSNDKQTLFNNKQITIPKMFSKQLKYNVVPPSLNTKNQSFMDYEQNKKIIQYAATSDKSNQIQANTSDILTKQKQKYSEDDNASLQQDTQQNQIAYLSQFYSLNLVSVVGAKTYQGQNAQKRLKIEYLVVVRKNSQNLFLVEKKRVQKQMPQFLIEYYQKQIQN